MGPIPVPAGTGVAVTMYICMYVTNYICRFFFDEQTTHTG